MDQPVQCPVCTLYLHNGMSLESHLDTHPKDQVIKALCNLSANGGYSSRSHTPSHSERSYRSRSQTPADEVGLRWTGSLKSSDHDRSWRRTPNRTPRNNCNMSRIGTPSSDARVSDINFENSTVNNSTQCSTPFAVKTDKMQQTYIKNLSISEFDQQYGYYPEQPEEREIKYSRSADYTPIDHTSNLLTYNVPTMTPTVNVQTTLLPSVPRRTNELVKLLPKTNNILVKTNVGGVQYVTPAMKPMHVVMPAAPTFVQKSVHNNTILKGNLSTTQMLDSKVGPIIGANQTNQQPSSQLTPGTTVVTQNSQTIFREMLHNVDGKPFVKSMPTILNGCENTSVAQATSLYQNVMLVDQYGHAACMYATPQHVCVSKSSNSTVYNESIPSVPIERESSSLCNDPSKTLIIEVSPIMPETLHTCDATTNTVQQTNIAPECSKPETSSTTKIDVSKGDSGTKGLKILSNIKVEVPVQHHKNMINTVLDLTGPSEHDYPERPISPEQILPDLEDNNSQTISEDCTQPSTSTNDSVVSNTFSVIKNIGNPPSYKEAINKSISMDTKIEECSDSCPIPDLICNEKPSISPCSELSESGENSNDPAMSSTKLQINSIGTGTLDLNRRLQASPLKQYRNNPLRLNNIYLKKNKKILQIKNAKPLPLNEATVNIDDIEPAPSSSKHKPPETFMMSKIHHTYGRVDDPENVKKIKDSDLGEFDANIEEKSMDIEPLAHASGTNSGPGLLINTSIDVVQIKEEINTSNEDGFSNETQESNHNLTSMSMESLRPINVITYGNISSGGFDDEQNQRELLDIEATSKNKQFVNMMNEHYFGDNIYADYFTPDRVEAFDAEREVSSFNKQNHKEGVYIWGESSQRESTEFVLPNFIHESYRIAESCGGEFSSSCVNATEGQDLESGLGNADVEADSKADLLSEGDAPLNICTDERMLPRGELSGQESNGDLDTWGAMATTSEGTYDLLARERWLSDGSDVEPIEKREALKEEKLGTHVRRHRSSRVPAASPTALSATAPPAVATYSRLLSARLIKKEEKIDVCTGESLSIDMNKVSLGSSLGQSLLQVSQVPGGTTSAPRRRRRDYVCPACKEDQGSDAAFHAHLKVHPLECLTCGKYFYRRANLALHLKIHLGIRNYKCEFCDKRFMTRQKLTEHHNVHTGRAPVKCTHCDQTFRRYSNMVQHRDRHHLHKKAKVRDFVCRCGGVFHSRAKLRWHQETHDDKPKACHYCSDKFVHAASLTRHVRRMHNSLYLPGGAGSASGAGGAGGARGTGGTGGKQNVTCPVCKQHYLRGNLRAHLATHSGQRAHSCVICSKSFTTAWNLKQHRWTHASRAARPHPCRACPAAYVRRADLQAHSHSHRATHPYTCNLCGRRFIRKYNCMRHLREHEQPKRFACKVAECGKTFHRSYYLSEHMKVHSGARPFACPVCGKTSASKSNHNKHLRIHHARDPLAPEA